MKKIRYTILILLTISIALIILWDDIDEFISRRTNKQISIEATFMQYACGDWNVDMNVRKVNDSAYSEYIGRDIDPHTRNSYKLKDYFYDNKTKEFGMTYRLTGYISKNCLFGCDNTNPKFYIETIEKMDGTTRVTKDSF